MSFPDAIPKYKSGYRNEQETRSYPARPRPAFNVHLFPEHNLSFTKHHNIN